MQDRQAEIDRLTQAGDAAAEHRQRLQSLRTQLTQEEAAIGQRLEAVAHESQQLDQLLAEKRSTYFQFYGWLPLPGKKWLELPVLDAFNSPRKIDNVWSAGLDQPSGSFGRVPRFDRCRTCHQGIQQTLVDAPQHAQLPPAIPLDLTLELPPAPEAAAQTTSVAPEDLDQRLRDLFGFELAQAGLLHADAPTVQRVLADSLAAGARVGYVAGQTATAGELRAAMLATPPVPPDAAQVPGLLVGDVVTAIDGAPVPDDADRRAWIARQLLDRAEAQWAALAAGEEPRAPIRLTIERGLTHPYAGHPRLDLFVGPNSPHPVSTFGCTVCHEGQGSATAFEWTAHVPNDPATRRRWKAQYGWFDNPHWDFPMYPQRFAESLCLKCHPRVLDLESSERFPDPPAPKLLAGYRLIRTFGCFGCHEIDGYGRPGQLVAPDLRLEPAA